MARLRTVKDTIGFLPSPKGRALPAPKYNGPITTSKRRLGLAVESMKRHMTDEGWQIFQGLETNGYQILGHNLPAYEDNTCVRKILDDYNPSVVLMQDKREWDVPPGDFRDAKACFRNVGTLKNAPHVFKLTILKDSHQKPAYHSESAAEMGCHGWVIYYHPTIVKHLAPYVRLDHCIRTYHSIDRMVVPPFRGTNGGVGMDRPLMALVSGAVSGVYPLRSRVIGACVRGEMPGVNYLKHPGYHRNGCSTPDYLKVLASYKVSICTSSIFGYALRKIIESTACGCRVITDLPTDEVLPMIDGNLTRIPTDTSPQEVLSVCRELASTYDDDKQAFFALEARKWYDYHETTARLAQDIENMRREWAMESAETGIQ